MCHTNHIKGKGKYFSRWKALLKDVSKDEMREAVVIEVEKLTRIKEEARKIEDENVTMADENDELRQFS